MLNAQEISTVKKILGGKNDDLAVVFSALSDQTRCYIFRSFLKQSELCVSDIAKIANISMSSASQHLKILELKGLATKERRGRVIYYTPNLANPIVRAIIEVLRPSR